MNLKATREGIQHVKERLESHADVVASRWKKYSHEKRAALLRESSKGVFDGIWNEVETWSLNPKADEWGVHEPCVASIGWLNHFKIQELAEDHMALLSLLHLRSQYEPQQWAAFDTREAFRGYTFETGRKFHRFNANSVLMHGEEYGRLKPFDINAARSYQEVGFPRAWLTFMMQKLVAQWLVAVVDGLIGDSQPSGNTRWTAMIAGGLRSARDQVPFGSYERQECAVPTKFDPDVILKKARDHLNMLIDEIQLMQTSPEAMRQYVLEEKANTGFKEHKSKQEVWQYVSQTLTSSWTRELERWHRLVAECEHLQVTVAKSGLSQLCGARLPKEIDTAVKSFGRAVHKALKEAASEWTSHTRTINIMSEHLRRMMRVHREKVYPWNLDSTQHSHQIIRWCLQLASTPQDYPAGSSWVVRKLKEELEGTTYSTGLENWISGISLLDEFAISWTFRQTIDHNDPLGWDAISLELVSRDAILTPTFDVTDWQTQEPLSNKSGDSECSQLLRTFCELPLPKGRQDMKWLEKMTEARKSLTEVWTCIRNSWSDSQRKIGKPEEFMEAFLSHMSFDISQEYLVSVAAESQQIQVAEENARRLKIEQEQGTGFVQQAWDHKISTDGAVRKNLTKKSNAAHVASSDAGMEELRKLTLNDDGLSKDDAANVALTTVRHIAVKQDSFSVMLKMFSTADGSSGVRWTVLLQVLTDAGLTITPGAGLAMSFANEHGTISIHKPHPEPVVDAIRLRGIGRRLNKWFGWTSETFVLREKGDKKS
jgi:hypothetical protein